MDCGIYALEYLLNYYHLHTEQVIERLESQLDERGLSIFQMVEACHQSGFTMEAYHSFWIYKKTPYIAYLRFFKFRHFVVITKVTRWKVQVYDGQFEKSKFWIWKPFFYFLWGQKIMIMI